MGMRIKPVRQRLVDLLPGPSRAGPDRSAALAHFDGRFAAHPLWTLLHIAPGGVFLRLAPLQFSSSFRNRHLRFHRRSGRVLVVAGLLSGAGSLYFGLLMPFGPGEAIVIALFGGLYLVAVGRGLFAIRKRDIGRHREWMVRAFAIALAISTIRVIGAFLDLTLTPAGWRPQEIFALSLWTGWAGMLLAAELWIRYTTAVA
jgi:uncharacterized membrane protein